MSVRFDRHKFTAARLKDDQLLVLGSRVELRSSSPSLTPNANAKLCLYFQSNPHSSITVTLSSFPRLCLGALNERTWTCGSFQLVQGDEFFSFAHLRDDPALVSFVEIGYLLSLVHAEHLPLAEPPLLFFDVDPWLLPSASACINRR